MATEAEMECAVKSDLVTENTEQHDVIRQPNKLKRKRGILGAPQGSRMLFNFTSKELWPDDGEVDGESDSDYVPDEPGLTNGPTVNGESRSEDDQTVATDQVNSNGDSTKMPAIKLHLKLPKPPASKRSRKSTKSKVVSKKTSPKSYQKKVNKKLKNGKRNKKANAKEGAGNNAKTTTSITSYNDLRCIFKETNVTLERKLPSLVLNKIFCYVVECDPNPMLSLIKLSQVCEEWRQFILNSPQLFGFLDLALNVDDLKLVEQLKAFNLLSSVRALRLVGWDGHFAQQIVETVTQTSKYDLTSINLRNCRKLPSSLVQTIIQVCPKLKSLDISSVTYLFGIYNNISLTSTSKKRRNAKSPGQAKSTSHQSTYGPFASNVFGPLLETCGSSLEKLYMSENTITFAPCLFFIQKHCPNLKVLDISNVASLNSHGSVIHIEKLQLACPQLSVLRAANINFKSESNIVTGGFPYLKELSIPYTDENISLQRYGSGHTDAILEQLLKTSEELTLLDLRGAGSVTPRGLVKAPCWKLSHLSIGACPKMEETSLEMVFTKWRVTLVEVDISLNKSEECINACVNAISEGSDEESPLESILLRGSAISLAALTKLVQSCPKLTSVDLQSCRSLPRGIKRLYADQEFQELRKQLIGGKFE